MKAKWLHTLGSIGLVAITVLTPSIQGAISSHPEVSAILAAAYAILGQFAAHKPADPNNTGV